MSRKEKLINRFLECPSDFTFNELTVMLDYLGFECYSGGKTSGSLVKYRNRDTGTLLILHKPHPQVYVKVIYLKRIKDTLESEGLI